MSSFFFTIRPSLPPPPPPLPPRPPPPGRGGFFTLPPPPPPLPPLSPLAPDMVSCAAGVGAFSCGEGDRGDSAPCLRLAWPACLQMTTTANPDDVVLKIGCLPALEIGDAMIEGRSVRQTRSPCLSPVQRLASLAFWRAHASATRQRGARSTVG